MPNMENFIASLTIMWKGMLGIFSVIILITLIVIFLQWIEKKLPTKTDKHND